MNNAIMTYHLNDQKIVSFLNYKHNLKLIYEYHNR